MESMIPFPEETDYLEHVMQSLDEAFADAQGSVERLDREYSEFKRYLVEYRNENVQTLLIQGVAGSGKTSIALHRVAYLLYRFKGALKAQDVAIVSPNKVFANYISNVIPELGEEPIVELGLDEIAAQALDGVVAFEPARNPLEVEDAAWQQRARFKSTPPALSNCCGHMRAI